MAAVWSCNLNRSSGEVGAEAQVAARPSGGLLRCPIDGEREREREIWALPVMKRRNVIGRHYRP